MPTLAITMFWVGEIAMLWADWAGRPPATGDQVWPLSWLRKNPTIALAAEVPAKIVLGDFGSTATTLMTLPARPEAPQLGAAPSPLASAPASEPPSPAWLLEPQAVAPNPHAPANK